MKNSIGRQDFNNNLVQHCFYVADPFFRKRNVARSLSHAQIFEFIDYRLRVAFAYFGSVRTNSELPYQFTEEMLSDKNVS